MHIKLNELRYGWTPIFGAFKKKFISLCVIMHYFDSRISVCNYDNK